MHPTIPPQVTRPRAGWASALPSPSGCHQAGGIHWLQSGPLTEWSPNVMDPRRATLTDPPDARPAAAPGACQLWSAQIRSVWFATLFRTCLGDDRICRSQDAWTGKTLLEKLGGRGRGDGAPARTGRAGWWCGNDRIAAALLVRHSGGYGGS
jgi:hypothetical protein